MLTTISYIRLSFWRCLFWLTTIKLSCWQHIWRLFDNLAFCVISMLSVEKTNQKIKWPWPKGLQAGFSATFSCTCQLLEQKPGCASHVQCQLILSSERFFLSCFTLKVSILYEVCVSGPATANGMSLLTEMPVPVICRVSGQRFYIFKQGSQV